MIKFLIILLLTTFNFADVVKSRLNIAEEDGSPSTYPTRLKVTNGQLTDNGDGTASLSTGATYTHPNHTGDVTSVADGATTIGAEKVVESMLDIINAAVNAYALTWSSGDNKFKWAQSAAGGGISNVVEDTTPQLGGDLDLNSKNIDFPTTANISDCLDEDNMASNSATKLATQQSIKAYADTKLSTASVLTVEKIFSLEGLGAVETAFGSLFMSDGTNQNLYLRAFDDTTIEYSTGKFKCPGNLTSGTVTFTAYVSPATGAASKNVQLTFEHLPINDGEAWDAAMTAEDSGNKAITATTGNVSVITWTETIANMGWAANDIIFFRVSRKDASADDLVGDMYWYLFTVSLPVTAT